MAGLGYITRPYLKKKEKHAGHQWFIPVILATWEAELWWIKG
jgi:hypothetical protein